MEQSPVECRLWDDAGNTLKPEEALPAGYSSSATTKMSAAVSPTTRVI